MPGNENMDSFNNVVKQYYPALVFFAEKTIDDRFAAQELVQDVFVRLWERKHDFNNDSNIRNYLYLSARNSCLNYLRDAKRRAQREKQIIPLSPVSEEDITNNIILSEIWREIDQAINTLPEQCRKVIKMAFDEGKDTGEIASTLGITESTVRNQKARGLSILRKILSDKAMILLISLI
jgi:RNA polymerase sigma-70 factor (family 1)